MKKKAKELFLEMIQHLRIRPGMFIIGNSYFDLCNFLVGYDVGVSNQVNFQFGQRFQRWLQDEKAGHQFSLAWPDFILLEMANQNSEIAARIVLDLWEEFLQCLGTSYSWEKEENGLKTDVGEGDNS